MTGGLLEAEGCWALAERALAVSRAEQTEVVLISTESALTRFANSAIHQNVSERNTELRVRVALGKRLGVASTNDLTPSAVAAAVARATEIAARQREDERFSGLPGPEPIPDLSSYHPATADCSPDARARGVKVICDLAVEQGLLASGALSTGSGEVAVANSLGVRAYAPSSSAHLKTVVMGDEGAAGYAERSTVRADELDFEAVAREAIDKTVRGRAPTTVPPGQYTVLLEEYAVGEALSYLSYLGFGALALQEEQSFLTGRLGEQVVGEQISIWDDGLDRRGLPTGFDFEGVPKRRVDLIERGVARGVVYDTRTAARDGTRSTGHALPAPNTFGPFAWNLFMGPGKADKERMVAGIERGLWVTRFHYVNVVQPRQAILTGMTRDGTFLIERGEVGPPLRNLRFTQNMLEVLSAVRAVGSRVVPIEGFFGVNVVPALLVDGFTFTGLSSAEA